MIQINITLILMVFNYITLKLKETKIMVLLYLLSIIISLLILMNMVVRNVILLS